MHQELPHSGEATRSIKSSAEDDRRARAPVVFGRRESLLLAGDNAAIAAVHAGSQGSRGECCCSAGRLRELAPIDEDEARAIAAEQLIELRASRYDGFRIRMLDQEEVA